MEHTIGIDLGKTVFLCLGSNWNSIKLPAAGFLCSPRDPANMHQLIRLISSVSR